MSTDPKAAGSTVLEIQGLQVTVVRKAIKNLHLGVYPPEGRVRVAAPLTVSDEAVRLAVLGKLGWIRKQQKRYQDQLRQSPREMVSGETHWFLGQRYRLRVTEKTSGPVTVALRRRVLELQVRPGASTDRKLELLTEWYRQELKALLPPLLDKWEARLGVKAASWGIKKMRTRWGTCRPETRQVWLNLELAKKPPRCLEYVLVHELLHLRHRKHDARFLKALEKALPHWRELKAELNAAPLAHEDWGM